MKKETIVIKKFELDNSDIDNLKVVFECAKRYLKENKCTDLYFITLSGINEDITIGYEKTKAIIEKLADDFLR